MAHVRAAPKLRVSFWQWQEIEGFAENRHFDGVFVQISKDAGATWASLPTAAQLQPPYIGTSGVYDQCPAFLAPLSGQKIWADKINNTWKQAHFHLPADYITKQFRLRFVFRADIKTVGAVGSLTTLVSPSCSDTPQIERRAIRRSASIYFIGSAFGPKPLAALSCRGLTRRKWRHFHRRCE